MLVTWMNAIKVLLCTLFCDLPIFEDLYHPLSIPPESLSLSLGNAEDSLQNFKWVFPVSNLWNIVNRLCMTIQKLLFFKISLRGIIRKYWISCHGWGDNWGLYLTSGLIAKGNSETHLLLRSSVPKTGRGRRPRRSRHDALRRWLGW